MIPRFLRLFSSLCLCASVVQSVLAAAAAPAPLPITWTLSLTWRDNADNETAFEMQRAAAATPAEAAWSTVATLPANTITFTDPGLAAGTWSYRVRATNTDGPSTWSNTATIDLVAPRPPAAPGDLQIKAVREPVPAATVSDAGDFPRRYGAHWIASISGPTKGLEPESETVARALAIGQSVLWVHADAWDAAYKARVTALLNAAAGTALAIVPGWPQWFTYEQALAFVTDLKDFPAVLQHHGRPVFACYDYLDTNAAIIAQLRAAGLSFDFWANPRVWDDNLWASTHPPSEGRRIYDQAGAWLAAHPEVDGMINFDVDLGVTMDTEEAVLRSIARNHNITVGCRAQGRIAVAGWAPRYYKESMPESGIRRVWEGILADAPDLVLATTANDIVEGTAVNKVGTDFDGQGNVYIPPRNAGYRLGDNVPWPVQDQSHYSELVRPYVDRFLALP